MAHSAEVATLSMKGPCLLRRYINLSNFALRNGHVHAKIRNHQAVRNVVGCEG